MSRATAGTVDALVITSQMYSENSLRGHAERPDSLRNKHLGPVRLVNRFGKDQYCEIGRRTYRRQTRGGLISPYVTLIEGTRSRRAAVVVVASLLITGCTNSSESPGAASTEPPPPTSGAHFTPQPIDIVTEPAATPLESACRLPLKLLRRVRRGYYPGRSPDVLFVPREPNFFGGFVSTSHSGPWDYVQDVPLVLYGPGFIRPLGGIELRRETTVVDLAPTLAELLGIEMPESIPGQPISRVLVPLDERPAPRPNLIFVVVWDGGGWNVLNAWPDAWPGLKQMMREGASVLGASVGSSPSVTPAIHASIGTGAFPRQHGIVDIPFRIDSGRLTGAFRAKNPQYLELPTFTDLWDASIANAAKAGVLAYKSWHFTMLGHGAAFPGGDHDIAVVLDQKENFVTNPNFYSMPEYIADVPGFQRAVRAVDLEDGAIDNSWMGHEVLDDPRERRDTPIWVLYQTKLLKTIVAREGFGADDTTDIFLTNYKQIDEVGHRWNMLNLEMREILEHTDDALADLTSFLDRKVGEGRWVMAMTADHGQGPDAQAAGAWPISMGELVADVARHFGVGADELLEDTRPVGFWLNARTMETEGITEEDISEFLLAYRLEDNLSGNNQPPAQYGNRLREPVLAAAFPGSMLERAWDCARG
jgi:hypothetical protein